MKDKRIVNTKEEVLELLNKPNQKFDMHLHSLFSSNVNISPIALLERAEKEKLDFVAITDYDEVKGFEKLDDKTIAEVYSGKVITASEVVCYSDDNKVETLMFGIDIEKIKDWKHFNTEYKQWRRQESCRKMVEQAKENGFEFLSEVDYSQRLLFLHVYNVLVEHEGNKAKLEEAGVSNPTEFVRKLVNVPNDLMYVKNEYIDENGEVQHFWPTIEEVCEKAHEAGGIAVMAHPYAYNFSNPEEVLESVVDKQCVDGIECMHGSASIEQMDYLLNYTKNANLVCTGGSDFHGDTYAGKDCKVGRLLATGIYVNTNDLIAGQVNSFVEEKGEEVAAQSNTNVMEIFSYLADKKESKKASSTKDREPENVM